MKNKLLKLALFALVAVLPFAFTSCDGDDDNGGGGNPTLVEDGFYIKGEGTALTALDSKGMLKVTRNEVLQEERAALLEMYIAVKAGDKGFNIVEVAGAATKVYGPGADFAEITGTALDAEEPNQGLWKGSYAETATAFTVPTDGLYHVVIDKELKKVAVAKVVWGLIGAATPGGWSGSTALTEGAFDLNKITFELAEITMLENEYKLRYSNGWKIILDAEFDLGDGKKGIKVNTNLGGALDNLVPGAGNIANTKYGVYKATITWELGKAYAASLTWVKDGEPLATYPEALYLVGDATAYAWDSPSTHADAIMHKCAGGAPSEGIFWKILFIEGTKGFKVSEADWGTVNLGFAEVNEFDADGVTVTDNNGNMSVADNGMYIIVVNLQNKTTKISVKPAEVYGIGDAFGGYNEAVAANKFTADNTAKTLTSPAVTANGNIRMYAEHAWIPEWWNAEFNVFNGVIEYRNDGGDQEAVPGTAGQVITLTFDNNTGTIQ